MARALDAHYLGRTFPLFIRRAHFPWFRIVDENILFA
jgi:hypothetical protein